MTTAAAIAKMPTWPRRMQQDLAAAYCGVSSSKFLLGIRCGKFPEGRKDDGNVLWYLEDLDAALDRLKGNGGTLGLVHNEDADTAAWMQGLNDGSD